MFFASQGKFSLQLKNTCAYNGTMKPKTIVKKMGGIDKTAARLGYTTRAIRYWLAADKIPRHAQKWIAIVLAGKVNAEIRGGEAVPLD